MHRVQITVLFPSFYSTSLSDISCPDFLPWCKLFLIACHYDLGIKVTVLHWNGTSPILTAGPGLSSIRNLIRPAGVVHKEWPFSHHWSGNSCFEWMNVVESGALLHETVAVSRGLPSVWLVLLNCCNTNNCTPAAACLSSPKIPLENMTSGTHAGTTAHLPGCGLNLLHNPGQGQTSYLLGIVEWECSESRQGVLKQTPSPMFGLQIWVSSPEQVAIP